MTEGADRTAIRTAGVFDPDEGTVGPGVVIVANGRVVERRDAVPSDVEVAIDHDGYAIPGLVDAHSHATVRPGEGDQLAQLGADRTVAAVRAANNLAVDLAAGTTTMRLMAEEGFLDVRLAELEREGELTGPRLLPSGIHLTPTGGHGHVDTATDGVEAIRRRIRRNVQEGATHTKYFATGGVSSKTGDIGRPMYTREEVEAIVDESHRQGIHVAAHAHGGAGATMAIEAGVDTIEHASALDEPAIDHLADSDQFAVGTFSISGHPEGIRQGDADSPEIIEKLEAAEELREQTWETILRRDINVAVGTDSMHGLMHYEIETLIDLGATPAAALAAATIDAARCIRRDDEVGSLDPGKRADLVLLDDDPLATPSTLATPAGVVKDGQRVH